jgi:Domain of unknown function (DUF4148)
MHRSILNHAVIALALAAAAFGTSAVHAENHPESHLVTQTNAESQLTRAEVLADLKIYQESGLAAAERVYNETGLETAALRGARQRYAQLRQGERYATLVAEIAQRTGQPVRQPRGA